MNRPQRRMQAKQSANLALGKANRSNTDSVDERVILTTFLMARQNMDDGVATRADLCRMYEMVCTLHHLGGRLLASTPVAADTLSALINSALHTLSGMAKRFVDTGKVGMSGEDRKVIIAVADWLEQLIKVATKGLLLQSLCAAAADIESGMMRGKV